MFKSLFLLIGCAKMHPSPIFNSHRQVIDLRLLISFIAELFKEHFKKIHFNWKYSIGGQQIIWYARIIYLNNYFVRTKSFGAHHDHLKLISDEFNLTTVTYNIRIYGKACHKTSNRRRWWPHFRTPCHSNSHIKSTLSPFKHCRKWNESGFRPPLCTYRLNWARRTSWGWWDD